LLTAYRRAANIVRIEEKKDGISYNGDPDRTLFEIPAEGTLAEQLDIASKIGKKCADGEQFIQAMAHLAALRGPVDEFFARVTVNVPVSAVRANRLRLLARIRNTLNEVADFSQIEG
ncbi:MAG TPA: DALR anticodon-binding domain-containing protein, partial [Stellaceae bacterium]|nr:DALR anticodon-binding domain-containing protein [Stellaceae bacterium]